MKKPLTVAERRKAFIPLDVIEREKPIRNSVNFRKGQSFDDFEHPEGVSETVPDQSLSITDILNRHRRGLPVRMHDHIFMEDEMPNLAKMDLTERQEVLSAAKEDVSNKRKAIQRQASEAARPSTTPPAPAPSSPGITDANTPTVEVPK